MSPPCKGRNLPIEKHDDEGTDVGTCGNIMKPGNGIRRSLYPETKPQRWEKLLTNEYTEKDVTPAALITDRLRIGSES